MTTEQMLEQRHDLKLVWHEQWAACGPEGNDLNVSIEMHATVHDCINIARLTARRNKRPTIGEDEQHLRDFMAIHWATVVE